MLITIEGIDGCGKTTFATELVKRLRELDVNVIHTRELGGTPVSEKIRRIVLENDTNNLTDLLLAFSSRIEHVNNLIIPAINNGDVVICERFVDSTYAYQVYGKNFEENITMMDVFNSLETYIDSLVGGYTTFFLDVPLEVATKRMEGRIKDKFEQDGDLQASLLTAYKERIRLHPNRFKVLDVDLPLDNVNIMAQTWAEVIADGRYH